MADSFDAYEVAQAMAESRASTRALLDLVISESDLRRSPGFGFRPLLWHLGHIGAFESYWILQRVKGEPTLSPGYDEIFDPIKTPRADSLNLPPVPEITAYLDRVREYVLDFLARFNPDADDPLLRGGYVFDMVLEHEYQHQETLLYLLQMLDPQLKRKPPGASREAAVGTKPRADASEMVKIAGGQFEMGSRGYPFAYDNEQPPHTLELRDYRIDKYPVTNAEFARFIEAGGYSTRSLWSDEGWAWKEENRIDRPLYWTRDEQSRGEQGEGWRVKEMFEEVPLRPDHPVAGVSFHEAESYARFVGKRLPTEAEWEKAASWDARASAKRRFSWGDAPADASLTNYNSDRWGTTPVGEFDAGRSAYGCFDMTGNTWEWTSTPFGPYPGFAAFPYPEYSEIWFDGDHRVLKGGSWATRMPLLRCSFRNFFRPRFRIAFAGFRCAADE